MREATDVTAFDVFDTIVTRRTHVPIDAFLIIGRHLQDATLIPPSGGDEWARRRADVERALRRAARHEEVRLGEIYDRLAQSYGWSSDQTSKAIGVEVGVERALLAPVSSTLAEFDELRRSGPGRVVLISDSYLSRAQLSEILAPHVAGQLPELFVSSESRRTKHTGALFSHVSEKIAPATLREHVGDNPHSDVRMALARGVSARLVTTAWPNRYEEMLASPGGLEASLVAGCARAARVGAIGEDERRRVLGGTGADVVGPFIGGYVLWVLRKASELGLRRLYFVSRDGELMLRLARHLADATRIGVECRYLFGSRQAWHAASYDPETEPVPSWLFERGGTPLTTQKVLQRLGMPANDAAAWAGHVRAGVREGDPALLATPGLREHLSSVVQANRALLREYLVQEGLADGTPSGLVDIGWIGRAQESMESVLTRDLGLAPLHGFFVGLRLPRTSRALRPFRHAYVADHLDVIGSVVHGQGSLIEILCAAGHGGVIGYERDGARIRPRLRPLAAAYERWGVTCQQDAAERFVVELCAGMRVARGDWGRMAGCLRAGSAKALSSFAVWPSREEADVYGAFPHEYDQAGEPEVREFAPRVRAAALRSLARSGWPEGSLARAHGRRGHVRMAQTVVCCARALQRRLLG